MDMQYDKRALNHERNTFEVEFEPRAYSKMILHTAKYPHCAVTGLLLASGGRKSTGQIVLTDCIPLFHQSEGKNIRNVVFMSRYLLTPKLRRANVCGNILTKIVNISSQDSLR